MSARNGQSLRLPLHCGGVDPWNAAAVLQRNGQSLRLPLHCGYQRSDGVAPTAGTERAVVKTAPPLRVAGVGVGVGGQHNGQSLRLPLHCGTDGEDPALVRAAATGSR